MITKLKNSFLVPLSLALLMYVLPLHASEASAFNIKKSNNRVVREYLSVQKKYRKFNCSTKNKKTFDKLYSNYKKRGYYLPFLNEKVDTNAISSNIHLFKQKKDWIESEIKKWSKKKRTPRFSIVTRNVKNSISKVKKIIQANLAK